SGASRGPGAHDVASVSPHPFVPAQRPEGAGEDRAGAARTRQHYDDAQHLHARGRRIASVCDRRCGAAIVWRFGPKWTQIAGDARNSDARKRQCGLSLRLEAPPGFEPGVEVLQTSALPLGDGALKRRMAGLLMLKTRRPTLAARSGERNFGAGNGI